LCPVVLSTGEIRTHPLQPLGHKAGVNGCGQDAADQQQQYYRQD
jgi:hypothetical protein